MGSSASSTRKRTIEEPSKENDGDKSSQTHENAEPDDSNVPEINALNIMENHLKELSKMDEPWNLEGKEILNILLKKYYAKRRKQFVVLVGDLMIQHKFLNVCLRIWEFCHTTDEEKFSYLKSKAHSTMKVILWNYSDKCPRLAEEAYREAKLITNLMKDFSDPQLSVQSLKDNKKRYDIKSTLGILLNVVRLHNPVKELVRLDGGVQRLLEYYSSSYLIIKAKVMILLAYCITEEENEKIVTGTGVINFIVRLLGNALHSPNHIAKPYLFSAEEIVMGLDKLAFNDDNKKSIVSAGLLPLLLIMLNEECSPAEHKVALHCVWTLAFHPDNKDKITEETSMMGCVHRIHTDPDTDPDTRQSCDGIIFIIEGKEAEKSGSITSEGHVMISYQWGVQDIALQISEQLKSRGFSVWIDVEKMEGSILSSMGKAVENASVLLIAMTENYKNSNSCRTEAEYAYKLSKPILPLLLQPNYVPDGWLGVFVGVQLYVNLSHVDRVDDVIMDDLTKRIKNKMAVGAVVERDPGQSDKPSSVPYAAPNRSKSVVASCTSWTTGQVREWIAEQIGADESRDLLPQFDGVALLQLHKLLRRSPELYYRAMREEFKISWIDVLHLTNALESLAS